MNEDVWQSASHGDCLSRVQLQSLLFGDVSQPLFDEWERHVEDCPRCRSEIEQLEDVLDPLFLEIRSLIGAAANDLDSRVPPMPSALGVECGTVLGDFLIRRELGRGGMGVVFEAEQISLGRTVALKVLPFTAVLDPRQLKRFETEAAAAAALQHENIVEVYQTGCDRAIHFYAMRYVDGQDVSELIRQMRHLKADTKSDAQQQSAVDFKLASCLAAGNFASGDTHVSDRQRDSARDARAVQETSRTGGWSTQEGVDATAYFRAVAALCVQAAEAVASAHAHGVLHRDIKPSNLLVDRQGKLWITDFGLARVEGELGLTQTGDVVGTLRYMSPEQTTGDPSVVDERSDVFSLGATLYEMLALQPIYTAENRQALLKLREEQEPLPPRQIDPAIPVALESIVMQALARDPEDRYQSAQDLADDLKRYLDHQPIAAKLAGRKRVVIKSPGHRRAIAGMLMASLVLAGIVVVIKDQAGKEVARVKVPAEGSVVIGPEPEPQQPADTLPLPREPETAPLVPQGRAIFAAGPQTLGAAKSLGVAMGDFNEDGRMDVVVANHDQDPNHIWWGRGDGTFDNQPLPVGEPDIHAEAVAVGDLNGDKHLDLFFANKHRPAAIWLGQGDGTFIAGQNDIGNGRDKRVVLGDLDHDGDLDAVVVNHSGKNPVWIGGGDGTFKQSQVLHWMTIYTEDAAIGDLDGDGHLDVFLAQHRGNDLWLGFGNGWFNHSRRLPHGTTSLSVALGDLNEDGHLDAVVGNDPPHLSSVFLGDGHGRFQEYLLLGIPVQSESVALGDLDGDGHLDAFIAHGAAGGPPANHVWRGDGKGGLHFVQSLGDSYSNFVALGDLDGDGDLDAVVANCGNDGGLPNTVWINQTKSAVGAD